MTATCQCGRPVDGAYLCSPCTAALRATLEQTPGLVTELDITLTRQARFGDRAGGKSADKPLPYDVRASEATWVLRNTLTGWARVIVEEMGIPGPQAGLGAPNGHSGYPRQGADITTAQIALWLAGHVPALRTHPAAGEAHDEISQAHDQARRAIDRPDHDRHYLGPHTCGTHLHAKPGDTSLTCPGCGAHVNADHQRDHMRRELHDHLGTATYVAKIATGLGTPITPEAITIWHDRHYLAARHTRDGRRIYRVGDVLDVAQADRAWRKQRAKEVREKMSA